MIVVKNTTTGTIKSHTKDSEEFSRKTSNWKLVNFPVLFITFLRNLTDFYIFILDLVHFLRVIKIGEELSCEFK